ncbi:hypothetical protein GG496_000226 [Candidatus Fervidibacteria bacterium JGI MDM2 JNZ-1-D12]
MSRVVQLLKELLERTEQGKLRWEKISRIDYETVVKDRVRFTLSLVPTTKRFTGRARFTPDKYLPYMLTFKVENLTPVLYIVDVREDREIARISGDDPNLDRECVELLEDLYEMVEKQAQEPDLETAFQVLKET